jgi:hypothetical protein
MEDRQVLVPELLEHGTDVRDHCLCLCHAQRGAIQYKIVLHIDDEECSAFHDSITQESWYPAGNNHSQTIPENIPEKGSWFTCAAEN